MVLAGVLSQRAVGCQCAEGGSFLLSPLSTEAAHRNTRVAYLAFGTAKFAVDGSLVTIDGVETNALRVVQEETVSQQLTIFTFDDLLPAFAEIEVLNEDGSQQLRFTTSDVIDEEAPTWDGGVEYVRSQPDEIVADCIDEPYLGYKFKGYEDDRTPPDDLLVEAVSEYDEKVWGAYGAVGMGLGGCTSVVESLEEDRGQSFDVTFFDEAGNASRTHTVSGCSCASSTTGPSRLALVALLVVWVSLLGRRRVVPR